MCGDEAAMRMRVANAGGTTANKRCTENVRHAHVAGDGNKQHAGLVAIYGKCALQGKLKWTPYKTSEGTRVSDMMIRRAKGGEFQTRLATYGYITPHRGCEFCCLAKHRLIAHTGLRIK